MATDGRRAPASLLQLVIVLLLPCPGAPAREAPADVCSPTVILLSWDGVRHDYPERGEFPALERMAREGARAEGLVPPFPSNTFPSHMTLATGTHPDRHGIVNNRFREPGRGRFNYANDASWLEAEPLWVAAERQGVRSAVFFWVGSESDWRGLGASYRRSPFDSTIGEAEKVDQIVAWLDLPEPRRPRLVMAWWHGADHAGHVSGPDDPEIALQLATQDAQLSRLLAALDARELWASTTLLVVSDHGMSSAGRRLDARRALRDAGVKATVEGGGGTVLVYLEQSDQSSAARRALASLRGVTAYTREEIPERLRVRHGSRSGDLLALARPPSRFARTDSSFLGGLLAEWLPRLLGDVPGAHGYDPAEPDMTGIFFALGRGVVPGSRPGRLHAVDVAPTAAALLGIEAPRHAEGEVQLGASAP